MRIKRGQGKHQKHKKALDAAKGYRLSYSKLYRRSQEALMHAGQYSMAHRRRRPGEFRKTWIKRINAALNEQGIKYNNFINLLKKNKIELDRKILAALALDHAQVFAEVVKAVK
jgi:large subunit ribosomal protein L20